MRPFLPMLVVTVCSVVWMYCMSGLLEPQLTSLVKLFRLKCCCVLYLLQLEEDITLSCFRRYTMGSHTPTQAVPDLFCPSRRYKVVSRQRKKPCSESHQRTRRSKVCFRVTGSSRNGCAPQVSIKGLQASTHMVFKREDRFILKLSVRIAQCGPRLDIDPFQTLTSSPRTVSMSTKPPTHTHPLKGAFLIVILSAWSQALWYSWHNF